MLSLPLRVGPLTLTRRISADPVAETYQGLLHGRGDQPVRVRRLLPTVCRRPEILAQAEARVRDLLGVRHPLLAGVIEWIVDGEERLVVEEWVDGLSFAELIDWSRRQGRPIEPSVLLHLVTQACNALEALHARPGRGSGRASVLHMALTPSALLVDRDGRLCLSACGLVPTPALLVPEGSLPGGRLEYLSPEQTAPHHALEPASDLFVLGAIIGELALLTPIFRAESHLRTLRRVRSADASAELVELAERYPGLDRVVARCLARDPRQRYPRASSLREDLCQLLAPYRFDEVVDDTRLLIEAGLDAVHGPSILPEPSRPASPLVLSQPALEPEAEEMTPPAPKVAVVGAALPPEVAAAATAAAASHALDADSMVDVVQRGPAPPPTDEVEEAQDEERPTEPPTEVTHSGPRRAPARGEISSVFLRPPEPLPPRLRKAPLPAPPAPPPLPPPSAGPPPSEEPSGSPWLLAGASLVAAAGLVLLLGGLLLHREEPTPELEQMALRPAVEPAPSQEAAPASAPEPSPPAPRAPSPALAAAPPAVADAAPPAAAPPAPAPSPAAPPVATSSAEPAPRSEPVKLAAAAATPSRPAGEVAPPARAPAPPRSAAAPARAAVDLAPNRVSSAPASARVDIAPKASVEPAPSADLDRLASLAREGRLSKADVSALEALPTQHPDWGRARSLLLLYAQKSGDNAAVGRQLEALMAVPENRYNPLLLVDRARYEVNLGAYAQALDSARQAEKQWARIPSSQVFAKKAEIYEIQAAAWQGLFYQSQGDLSLLDQALRSWERYKEHVQGRSRPELGRKADAEIARLQQIRARVE